MDHRDLQFNIGSNNFNANSRMAPTASCNYYDHRSSSDDPYADFEGVQDLSYSAQGHCNMQESSVPAHQHDQDVSCMDLSLLLSSSKACDRQQIEDELPLNLTGNDREEEINRRLRQRQQSFCNTSYSYSYPFNDPPRSSQVFVAPDFLGMHELQDLRTHPYLDDATSLNLTYCPQTLDLSAQSLDLSLSGQDGLNGYENGMSIEDSGSHQGSGNKYSSHQHNHVDGLNLDDVLSHHPHHQSVSQDETGLLDLALLHQQEPPQLHHSLPPASSLPMPLSISQSLTSISRTSCNSNNQELSTEYGVLDLQQKNITCTGLPSLLDLVTPKNSKPYTCAQCGERFTTTSELIAHRETHSMGKPFPCDHPGCGQRFAKVGTLNRHIKTTHSLSRPHQCNLCDKRFAQKHDLYRHNRTHVRK